MYYHIDPSSLHEGGLGYNYRVSGLRSNQVERREIQPGRSHGDCCQWSTVLLPAGKQFNTERRLGTSHREG